MLNLNKLIPNKQHDSFLLPNGVTIIGNIRSNISGRLDGELKGNIQVDAKLIIGEEAVIKGDITAHQLIIYGKVEGNIECKTKAVICNNAVIKGAVNATTLEIEEGAVIEGAMTKNTQANNLYNEMPKIQSINGHHNNGHDFSKPPKTNAFLPDIEIKRAIVSSDSGDSWF